MDLLKNGKDSAQERLNETRIESPEPIHSYQPKSDLLTSINEDQLRKEQQQKERTAYKEYTKQRQTTSRLSYFNLNRVNALINLGFYQSFNHFIESMLDAFESDLSSDERMELSFMIESFEDQQRRSDKAKGRRKRK